MARTVPWSVSVHRQQLPNLYHSSRFAVAVGPRPIAICCRCGEARVNGARVSGIRRIACLRPVLAVYSQRPRLELPPGLGPCRWLPDFAPGGDQEGSREAEVWAAGACARRGRRFTAGGYSWCERNEYLWALEQRHASERRQGRIAGRCCSVTKVRACAGNWGRGNERLA